jgi:hypothetical protein
VKKFYERERGQVVEEILKLREEMIGFKIMVV